MTSHDSSTQLALFDELAYLSKPDRAIKWNIDTSRITVDAENGIVYGRARQPLTPSRTDRGYCVIGFALPDRKQLNVYVHRVIAYAEWGDAVFTNGIEVNHINEDKSDNRRRNLELVTSSANKHHSIHHRYGKYGKITASDVVEIRRLRSAGMKLTDIAERYSVHWGHISAIVLRKVWKWLE